MSDTASNVDPTCNEEVELPSDTFDEGTPHADQTADPLPGSPA